MMHESVIFHIHKIFMNFLQFYELKNHVVMFTLYKTNNFNDFVINDYSGFWEK